MGLWGFSIWYMVYGIWYMAFGAMVSATRFLKKTGLAYALHYGTTV